MSDIPKTYDPSAVEPAWYQRWCDAGCFTATIPSDAGTAAPHAIMMPPPNVTGVLHMGHLLDNTIPDILTRRARQEGRPALWLPGTDHAGIATQSRVEKELRKAGKTRHDLGRERFIAAAAEWRDRHGGIILEQLKKLGASCDWSRRAHTLDAGYSRAVLNAFVTLYHRRGPDGRPYIYRGRRMVNWCPVSLTGLSDEEVIMKPQKGVFYRMRYEVADAADLPPEKRFVEIGTTRPETIPGDTAVAVHPDDLLDGARYAHLRGRSVWRPFPRAKIPVVADAHVERDFGSGVLKVTPAHDKADFEIGRRHDLPVIDVMNPDGTLNALAGDGLAGLDRFKARTAAAAKLRDLGLLLKEEPYENNVGFSERADVPIEPRLSEQWFIRYPKVPEALRAVESGAVKFHPERWVKTYNNWLNNIQDWCISRQLWWGHRIPVWYRKGADRDDPANRHVALEPPADPENWEQDNDVLDTWASSWLWCLATLGWEKPGDEKRPELADLRFWYPTASLTTGPDIIFLWVARMIIAGLEFYGDERPQLRTATGAFDDAEIARRIPFRDVYFHGIIRDEKGRKMSKSLGNSPEPLDLFAKYGADGVRFGLLSIAPKGQDILFSEDRISQGRNFCNKLWNAARFRQMQETPPATPAAAVPAPAADKKETKVPLGAGAVQKTSVGIDSRISETSVSEDTFAGTTSPLPVRSPLPTANSLLPAAATDDDHAILAALADATDTIAAALRDFDFNTYTATLYQFFWTDYCDRYVEASKPRLQDPDPAVRAHTLAVQDICLRQFLLLLHPITPFITEELAHRLNYVADGEYIQNIAPATGTAIRDALAAAGLALDPARAAAANAQNEFITAARALKAQQNQAAKKDARFHLEPKDPAAAALLTANLEKLRKLIGAAEIALVNGEQGDSAAAGGVPTAATPTPLGTLHLELAAAGDLDTAAERERLTRDLEKLEKQAAAGEAKLANPAFLAKAPPAILDGARAQLAATVAKRDEIRRLLAALG